VNCARPNMALQRTHRPRFLKVRSDSGAGVPLQEHAGTGRSLRSLGSPLERPTVRRQKLPSHKPDTPIVSYSTDAFVPDLKESTR
jgi:hypothetical protein